MAKWGAVHGEFSFRFVTTVNLFQSGYFLLQEPLAHVTSCHHNLLFGQLFTNLMILRFDWVFHPPGMGVYSRRSRTYRSWPCWPFDRLGCYLGSIWLGKTGALPNLPGFTFGLVPWLELTGHHWWSRADLEMICQNVNSGTVLNTVFIRSTQIHKSMFHSM